MSYEEILNALVTRCAFLKMRIEDSIKIDHAVSVRLIKDLQNSAKTLEVFLKSEEISSVNPFLFKDCLELVDYSEGFK